LGDYSNIEESSNQYEVLMPGYQNHAAGTFLPSSIKKIAVSGTCKRKADFRSYEISSNHLTPRLLLS